MDIPGGDVLLNSCARIYITWLVSLFLFHVSNVPVSVSLLVDLNLCMLCFRCPWWRSLKYMTKMTF